MENPFQKDKARPGDQAAASASAIKPFSAVDLGPAGAKAPAGPAARPEAQAPGVSPFLESFESPFKPKDDFVMAPAPKPSFAPPLASRGAEITAAPRGLEAAAPPKAHEAARASQALPKAAVELPAAPLPGPASSAGRRFVITTTPSAEGCRIERHLGIVSAELVIPKDLLFRNPAPYGELHRLKSAEDQLQKLKDKAMEELCERARQLGADGVVGVSLSYSALDAVACLCSAWGTAVKLTG